MGRQGRQPTFLDSPSGTGVGLIWIGKNMKKSNWYKKNERKLHIFAKNHCLLGKIMTNDFLL